MLSAILVAVVFAADARPADGQVDAVVVAPRELLPALQPLLAHREQQGHRLALVTSTASPVEIRAAIRRQAAAGGLKYVLLVGDADPAARVNRQVAERSVPTFLVPAVVNVQYGSEPQIASDNVYADLDDDQVPDIAVGRIPADTPAELSRIVAKILAYEQSADFGPWRERVNFVAGVGGFSPILDTVVETVTSKLLTGGIPPAYETRMTYGSWRSPYCPDPRLFHAAAVERHNEGCLFWVYIGHGQSTQLDEVSIPGERFHIFDVRDCRELRSSGGSPIALMLACYTAAFDQPQDCLAEQMLKADGGPVAVYGGSRVTMPYAMAVMGTAMMGEYFHHQPATLGEAVLSAKRRTMARLDDPEHPVGINRVLLDMVAALVSPNKDQLIEERREHLHLFNLLGDPMLRLTHPQPIALDAPHEATSGQTIRLSGHSEVAGRGVLELVCRRDCHKEPPPVRERFDPTDKALEGYQPVYLRSLDRCWARWGLELPAGDFTTEIAVPENAGGPCHLRLLVANHTAHAVGTSNVNVKRPEPVSVATSSPAAASSR
jgi:hypothetical protein